MNCAGNLQLNGVIDRQIIQHQSVNLSLGKSVAILRHSHIIQPSYKSTVISAKLQTDFYGLF